MRLATARWPHDGGGGFLTFRAGDLIEVLNEDFNNGWWEGRLGGQIGLFPANHVEIGERLA